MQYTLFKDDKGTKLKVCNTDELPILEVLTQAEAVEIKNQAKMLKLAVFGDSKTPKGSYRTNGNVTAVSGVEIDYDQGKVTPDDAFEMLKKSGISGYIVTTYTHTLAKPRWRCFALFSKMREPEDRTRYAEMLNAVFGGIGAPESSVLSQSYYIGGKLGSEDLYKVYYNEGKALDTVELPRAKFRPSDQTRANKLAKESAKFSVNNEDSSRHLLIHKLGIKIGKNRIDKDCLEEALRVFEADMRSTDAGGNVTALRWDHEFKNISDGWEKGYKESVEAGVREEIAYVQGMQPFICDQIIKGMVESNRYYIRGSELSTELVSVVKGMVEVRNDILLVDDINRMFTFFTEGDNGRKYMNCPTSIAKTVLAQKALNVSKFRNLKGVITAPTIRLDGSFLTENGYDESSKLYLHNAKGEDFSINESPSKADMENALEDVLYPFKDFPFETELDKSTFLAALITSVIRKVLPTSPMFVFEASTAGSGKSLLQDCVSILASGKKPANSSVSDRNDDEIRKSLFAALRTGAEVLSWDNLSGKLDSDALCMFLTSETINDRVLGVSDTLSLPNTALFLGSGNNLTLVGDLNRRIFKISIAPNMENPHLRSFDLNPLDYCTKNRMKLIKAVLTLLAGYLSDKTYQRAKGSFASFEDWDYLVRNCVIYLGYEDPVEKINNQYVADPQKQRLSLLMTAWYNFLGDRLCTMKYLIAPSATGIDGQVTPTAEQTTLRETFMDALQDICTDSRKELNSRMLGGYLSNHKNRVIDELKIDAIYDKHSKSWRYRVVKIS